MENKDHPVKYTVKVKSEDRDYKKKFLQYEGHICVNPEDAMIKSMVASTLEEVKTSSPIEQILVLAQMEL